MQVQRHTAISGSLKNARTAKGNHVPPPDVDLAVATYPNPPMKENIMLGWALTFLVIALIAAALGFGGIAGTSAGIAQILFVVFIILFVVTLISRAVRGNS